MRHDHAIVWTCLRGIALGGVAALGLIAIVGSGGGGGGGDAPQCSFFSDVCNPVLPPSPPPAPAAAASPLKLVVQAGVDARFTAQTVGVDQPRLQWRRSADGGVSYVDIPGATGLSLTLANAQLADDGALFRLDLRRIGNDALLATSNAVTVLVSSRPALVFEDGDFPAADWSASAMADPAQNGPTHSEDRSATGGLPDAFRHMVHTMTAGPSSLRVFSTKASALYDPQALGAIHAIDYHEDCSRLSGTSSS